MGNLTSTLSIKLTDGVSGPAGKAANALRGLGASGSSLKKLAAVSPDTAKLIAQLERLKTAAGAIEAFKKASRGLGEAGQGYRAAQQGLAKLTAELGKAKAAQDALKGVKGKGEERKAAGAEVKRLEREVRQASAAVKEHRAAVSAQVSAIRQASASMAAAVPGANNLKAAEAGLAAATASANAQIAKQPQLLAAIASGADAAARASRRMAEGMATTSAASRRMVEGMSAQARATRETAAAERKAHVERLADARTRRREALGTVGDVAGIAAGHRAKEIGRSSVLAVADYDHAVRSQRVFTDVDGKDQSDLLIPQALRIGQETKFSNTDVVKAQTASMQGLPPEFGSQLKAEVAAGIVENVKYYATLMDVDLKDGAETVRAYLQASGKDISTKEKALHESQKAVNQIVKMSKLGGMNGEDAAQYVKYATAPGTTAGLSTDTMFTLGALARRGGLRGDEAGVFMRSASSKLVAPTRDGILAMQTAGVRYKDYVKMPDSLSTDNLEGASRNKLGKSFTPAVRQKLDEINADKALIADREKYVAAVTEAMAPVLGKKKDGTVRASDSKTAAKMAGDFHKLSAQSVDTEGLLDAIAKSGMTAAQLNAMFTDKHGGKFSMTQKKWDEFWASREQIRKSGDDPNFAKKKSDEVMAGIYGSFENLKGSVENLYLAIGKANEGLLKFAFDAVGNTLDLFSQMPKAAQQVTSLAAGALAGALALKGAFGLTKTLLGGGSAVALTGSAGALTNAAGALTTAAARLGAGGAVGAGANAAGGAAAGAAAGGALGAAAVAGGVAVGGVAASFIAREAVKNEDFAKPYLDNPLLGADPAGYGFGAGIVHAKPLGEAWAPGGREGLPPPQMPQSWRSRDVSGALGAASGGSIPYTRDKTWRETFFGARAPLNVNLPAPGLAGAMQGAASAGAPPVDASSIEAARGKAEELKSTLDSLGATSATPQVDGSALDGLGQQSDAAKAKLEQLGATSVAPSVSVAGIDAAIAKVERLRSLLASIPGAASAATASVASAGGASTGRVRQAVSDNHSAG